MTEDEAMQGIERRFMYSRFKRLMQHAYEIPVLLRMARRNNIHLLQSTVLDAGCGAGFGLEAIDRHLHPDTLHGCDIDIEAVERARIRVPRAIVRCEDLTSTTYPTGSFDAIFMCGVLHHVPAWRQAIAKLYRILAPGGTLLLDDHPKRSVDLMDRMLHIAHPDESRFTWDELTGELTRAGFDVKATALHLLGHFGFAICTKAPSRQGEKDPVEHEQ
jgi:SAM-dependent methyltransferase